MLVNNYIAAFVMFVVLAATTNMYFYSSLPLILGSTSVGLSIGCAVGFIYNKCMHYASPSLSNEEKIYLARFRAAFALKILLGTANMLSLLSGLSFVQSIIPQTALVGFAVNCTIAGASFFAPIVLRGELEGRDADDAGLQSLFCRPLASTLGFVVGAAACMYFAPVLATEYGAHVIAGVVCAMMLSYAEDRFK